MVKKLFKYEFLAFLRVWLPTLAVLFGISLIGRIIQIFETDSTVYQIINGFSIFTYVVAIFVLLGVATVFSIVRFYKNLFTGEGYLSFTLPVTPTQHILVKAFTAIAMHFATLVAILISFCIFTFGDVFLEFSKAGNYLFAIALKDLKFHLIFYILECLVLFTAILLSQFLFYATCISIGQLFKKNRVLAAVGVYFGFYMLSQILSTIFTVLFAVFGEYIPIEKISNFFTAHPQASVHIIFCALILLTLISAVIYFFVTKTIIKRKLNLE
ncbi:MAG: hypothetical protein E7560_04245 [Ruminococcaceae bacterium]|nr:hypothetical protein [Oscillospiraceae bacterium]